jgi:y4mF family transcriptional regulator
MIPYGKVETPADLGRLVRLKRRSIGLRQADLAALAGVGTRFLSELENGKETAEIGRALRVCRRLGLEIRAEPRGRPDGERAS